MLPSIVYIETHDDNLGEGTGSIVGLLPTLLDPMLLTCNHVIPNKETARNCSIWFDRESAENPGIEVKGSELFDLDGDGPFKFTTHKKLDFTLIALKRDKIPPPARELFSCKPWKDLKVGNNVTLWQYPLNPKTGLLQQLATSSFRVLYIADKFLLHLAETHGGSSGSPVLGIVDNAWVVVGLHCAEVTNPKNGNKANKAILIKSIQDAINYPDEEDSAKPDYNAAIDEATAKAVELGVVVQDKPVEEPITDLYGLSPAVLDGKPTDAGLQGVVDITGNWDEVALALGVPNHKVVGYRQQPQPGVSALVYWRNGKIKNKPVTWRYLLEVIEGREILGPVVAEEIAEKLRECPDWTRK